MLQKLTRSRRWLVVPVALVAAAGFATQSGALSSLSQTSHTEHVCANLDAKEVRQQAALAQATPNSRHFFILEFNIAQTEKQEQHHGCGD